MLTSLDELLYRVSMLMESKLAEMNPYCVVSSFVVNLYMAFQWLKCLD